MSEGIDLIRLRKEVHESRRNLSREYAGLLGELDFREKISRSVRSHPFGWIGGAALIGFVTTLFGRGGSRQRQGAKTREPAHSSVPTPTTAQAGTLFTRAGIMAGLLQAGRLLYPLLKPVILEYASRAASSGMERLRRPRS